MTALALQPARRRRQHRHTHRLQVRVLALLNESPATVDELAALLRVDESRIRRVLGDLHPQGHALKHQLIPTGAAHNAAVMWIGAALRAQIGLPRHPPRFTTPTAEPLPACARRTLRSIKPRARP